jgi:hypothetical protein
LGYKRLTGKYWLEQWLKQFRESVPSSTAKNMFYNKHIGTASQTERVEQEHHTYFHCLYCEATAIIGDDTTFAKIVSQMNLLLTMDDAHSTMNLDKWN